MPEGLSITTKPLETVVTRKNVSFAIVIATLFLAIPRVLAFLSLNGTVLGYPYQLDYTEGIVWQQAQLMLSSLAYGPINRFPAIVFEYTPFFHLMARFVAWLTGSDLLLSGRVVSLGSFAISACVMAVLIGRTSSLRSSRWIALAIASALVMSSVQLTYAASLMRVDMLAVCLSMTGFLFGVMAVQYPKAVLGAAICFVLAVYTKQNSIAAPLATFGLLLWLRPRTALTGIVICVLGGAILLVALSLVTDGRFVQHIFLYNLNRIDVAQLRLLKNVVLGYQLPFILAAVFTFEYWRRDFSVSGQTVDAQSFRDRVRSNTVLTARVGLGAYLVAASAMLPGILKSGASDNYCIEWIYLLSTITGALILDVLCRASENSPRRVARAASFDRRLFPVVLVAIQLVLIGPPKMDLYALAKRREQLDSLVDRIRVAEKPVVSDEMSVVIRAGKPVEIEPAIFAELTSAGRWDETHFLDRIARQDFAFFITQDSPGNALFSWRYSESVRAAMRASYPRQQKITGYTLHLPVAID